MPNTKPDFSGFATKYNIKCSDGRTIQPNAFQHLDGSRVPLVWQHNIGDLTNIIGHAILEHRDGEGVYAYGYFNETETGAHAKATVAHGDLSSLSIFANRLIQNGSHVTHGDIKEISLVVSGANKGARIDNQTFSHGEETFIDDESAIIYSGAYLEHSLAHTASAAPPVEKEETVGDIFDTLSEKQKLAVAAILSPFLEEEPEEDPNLNHSEGELRMQHNLFEQADTPSNGYSLTHDEMTDILSAAKGPKLGLGQSLRDTFLQHAASYGIENIDVLFPDARDVRPTPDTIQRDIGWVAPFLSGIHKVPYSRLSSKSANLTEDEARAKGYITGSRKKEQVFPVMKRTTTPTTVYKKQKLDKDNVSDITDFDVIAWLKAEMREMLDEELARAALIGDGRAVDDEDHINEQHVRPVWGDDELYTTAIVLKPATGQSEVSSADLIDQMIRNRKKYKGTGRPNFYTTADCLSEMLLIKNGIGEFLYKNIEELKTRLRVNDIIEVEVMEGAHRTVNGKKRDLCGILLNPADYTMGADKGGSVAFFDDFDIDFNQLKFLIETRCSGALTKPKSAVSFELESTTGSP